MSGRTTTIPLVPTQLREWISCASNQDEAVFFLDDAGVPRWFSENFQEISGYSVDQIESVPDGFVSLIHEENREKWEQFIKSFTETNATINRLNYRIRDPDGSIVWLSLLGCALRHTDGSFVGIAGTLRDVTKKKMEEQVQNALIELIDFSYKNFGKDLLRKFLDEAEKLTESSIGFFHFVEPDQENLSLQVWSSNTMAHMCKMHMSSEAKHYPIAQAGVWVQCIREGKPVIHNDYARMFSKKGLPEGHAPIVRELVVPVFRGDKIVAILGVGNKRSIYKDSDVATVQKLAELTWETYKRREAEETILKKNKELEAIYNNSPQSMFLLDDRGQVVKANKKALEVTHLCQSENLRGGVGDLLRCIHSMEHEGGCGQGSQCNKCSIRSAINQAISENKNCYQVSVLVNREQGAQLEQTIYLLSTNALQFNYGKMILVCLEDITERRAAELELIRQNQRFERLNRDLDKARQEAEEANRAKGDFLAVMSHELRTPLNPILGFSQILMEDTQDETQKEWLEMIFNSAEHELELIDSILKYSRLERRSIKTQAVVFNFSQLVQQSVGERSVEHSKLVFHTNSLSNCPHFEGFAQIKADKGMIREVVDNLLDNASKYTPEGDVYVRWGLLESNRGSKKRTTLRVEVEDTGIGMDAKMTQRIFSPFTQVDNSFTRKFEGTGLGLAICKKLVETMKGELGVRSEIGKGSCFWFEIPVELANPDQYVDKNLADIRLDFNFPEKSVLIVEDVPNNSKIIATMLKRMGLKPQVCENGKLAVEHCKEANYDCIFMDLAMPVMSGLEAIQQIRNLKNHRETPIVAVTANASAGIENRCLKKGMQGYLTKPLRYEDLGKMLMRFFPLQA